MKTMFIIVVCNGHISGGVVSGSRKNGAFAIRRQGAARGEND